MHQFRRTFLLLACAYLGTRQPASADLFISSFNQNSVRRYDGSSISTFISAGSGGLSAPHRGMFGAGGDFYVASANNDLILRYDGATGAFKSVFIQNGAKLLPAGTLDYPVDMTLGPDGALYISSQLNDSVLRFDAATGNYLGTFVSNGSGGLDGPSGLAFHGGNLFVAGRYSNLVHVYDATTGAFVRTMGAGVLSTAYGLDFGPDGNLYVASGGASRVNKFDPATGTNLGAFVASGSGGLSAPIGVEFGADGNLYAASLNTDSVKEYNGTTGGYLGDFVATGSGGLTQPNFITFAVPEPATGSLLAAAAAFALAGRRRRQ